MNLTRKIVLGALLLIAGVTLATVDTTQQIPNNVDIAGNLVVRGNMPQIARSSLIQDNLAVFPIPFETNRIWDEYDRPLPDLSTKSAIVVASFSWDPNVADSTFFVANRDYRVLGITSRIEVVGTNGSAVTAAIKKAPSGTDIAAGTALLSSTIDLKGSVDTNQVLTLSTTGTDLDIPSGTSIGFDLTGTPTSARGVVSVFLVPISPDDLAFTSGAFGTGTPYITTGDVKNTTITRYCRFMVQLPPEYVAGETIELRFSAGMLTTVASSVATIDCEAYKSNRDTTKTGSDLVSTAAQSINSLTFANKDFVVTSTSLSPGDWLDVRVTIAVTDSATATAVTAAIGAEELLLDIKG